MHFFAIQKAPNEQLASF